MRKPSAFVAQSLALRDRRDQSDTLSSYDGPTLILCGREDKLCPVKRHEEMAMLMPHAHLEIIEGCGHISTLEAPEVVNAALEDWLSH